MLHRCFVGWDGLASASTGQNSTTQDGKIQAEFLRFRTGNLCNRFRTDYANRMRSQFIASYRINSTQHPRNSATHVMEKAKRARKREEQWGEKGIGGRQGGEGGRGREGERVEGLTIYRVHLSVYLQPFLIPCLILSTS